MEPEGSLLHLQLPATCPYPEPTPSSPCPHVQLILPTNPGSSKPSLSLRFPYQNPAYTTPLPHTCHMHCQSHSSRFDHPVLKQIINLLLTGCIFFIYNRFQKKIRKTFLLVSFISSPFILLILHFNFSIESLFYKCSLQYISKMALPLLRRQSYISKRLSKW